MGTEEVRRALCDWLSSMRLIQAGSSAVLDRYIGYYEPYATSHDALDRDEAVHEKVRNAARSLVETVRQMRCGEFRRPDAAVEAPREKSSALRARLQRSSHRGSMLEPDSSRASRRAVARRRFPAAYPRKGTSLEVFSQVLDGLKLAIRDDGMIEVRRPRILQSGDVRRPESPIAVRPSRHDVKMKMGNLLAAADPVVLV
jgi:hypothetical protein